MFKQERVTLHTCIECNKEIQVGKKMSLIYKDNRREYWVHTGRCYSKYMKLLIDPKKTSAIIGVCWLCGKPVRLMDEFEVARIEFSLSNRIFLRTIPKKGSIYISHKGCSEKEVIKNCRNTERRRCRLSHRSRTRLQRVRHSRGNKRRNLR